MDILPLQPAWTVPPVLKILVPFTIGLVCGYYIDAHALPLLLALMVVILLLLLVSHDKHWYWIPVAIAFIAAGWLRMEINTCYPAHHLASIPQQEGLVAVEGVICSPVHVADSTQRFDMRTDSIWIDYRAYPVTGILRTTVYDAATPLRYGDHIVTKGNLFTPPGKRNPGGFDYAAYLSTRGIHRTLTVRNGVFVARLERSRGSWLLQHLVYPVRWGILSTIDRHYKGQNAALLKGLLTGAREDINDDLYQAFANVGVVHVLAVSGLHVGFILFGLWLLCGLARCSRPLRGGIVISGLCFFALLTGGNPPVVRAVIMASIYVLGLTLDRRPHAINTLALAALVILLVNPRDLFSIGFQLSFSAVCGIVLLYRAMKRALQPYIRHWYERNYWLAIYLLELFLVSLAAQLATLPLTAWYFNRIPVISLLFNLPVVPLTAAVTGMGYLGMLISLLSQSLATWLFWLLDGLLDLLIGLVSFGSSLPFTGFELGRPSIWWMVFYVCLLLTILMWSRPQWFKRLLYTSLLVAVLALWSPVMSGHSLTVTFLDVGQGDAALFEYPGGHVLLVDSGDCTEHFDCGKSVIAPCLRYKGIRKINTLLITHAHSDHSGGAVYLLKQYPVGRLVMADVPGDSITQHLDSLACARHVPVRYVTTGDTLHCGAGQLLVLHPDTLFTHAAGRDASRLNDASIVLRAQWGRISFLMTGDAEHPSESHMLRFGDALDCDVLKLGHHGSRTASGAEFIRTVDPEYAVVSVGARNRFGLPSNSLLMAIESAGVRVLRTDEHGAVTFWSDGERVEVGE